MIFFKNFKRTIYWKYFLLLFLKPFYDFIWKYFINFHAKFLNFIWNFKKKEYFDLKNNNYLKITNNIKILNLVNELNNFCSKELLENSRNKMRQNKKWSNELFDELPID